MAQNLTWLACYADKKKLQAEYEKQKKAAAAAAAEQQQQQQQQRGAGGRRQQQEAGAHHQQGQQAQQKKQKQETVRQPWQDIQSHYTAVKLLDQVKPIVKALFPMVITSKGERQPC